MSEPIWDIDDGDFLNQISDQMAMDWDGHMMMRMTDNMAMDLDSGDIHITSSWNRNNDDDDE